MADSLDKLLAARKARPGSLYKLAGHTVIDLPARPAIDESKMSATAVISTPRPDRVRDSCVPTGVRLEAYRLNPVVLWEHGLGSIDKPIAKSEHADGRLSIEVFDDRIEGTAYHTDRNADSEAVFGLLAEKIVRAASVRVGDDNLKTSLRRSSDGLIVVIEEWDLIEWSWGMVGVNPEAVTKVLDCGHVGGCRLSKGLVKSLRPHAATVNRSQASVTRSVGAKTMPMDELAKRAKELTDEEIQGEIAVAQEEGAGDVAEVLQAELQSRKGDEGEMEDDDKAKMCGDRKKMEGEGEGEGEMEDDEMKAGMGVDDFDLNSAPPSARFLSGTHRGLAKLSQMLAGAKMQVENPDVLAYTDEMDEMLKNMMSQSESLFSGVTEGKAMTYGDDTEDDDEMNHFKSWVMGQASRPLQVHGIAAQLKTICAKDALDDKDKARLTGIAAQLDRIGEVGRAERRKTLEAEARRAKEREEADKQNKLQPADTSFLNEWKQDVEAARKKAADLGMV